MDLPAVVTDPSPLESQPEQAMYGYVPMAMLVLNGLALQSWIHVFWQHAEENDIAVKHLPDLMGTIAIDILEHVGELKEEFVRILLARGIHVVDFAFMR